jgi:hypothetical protein
MENLYSKFKETDKRIGLRFTFFLWFSTIYRMPLHRLTNGLLLLQVPENRH